jgi:hypothetical protein
MTDNRKTLCETLKALVRENQTGLLALKGANGFQASIYWANGEIVMIEDGKLYGAPAAKNIAKRIQLVTEFHENRKPDKRIRMDFTTTEFIQLIAKTEKAFNTFATVISSLEAVFTVDKDGWGKEEVGPRDLQILMNLDGQRTVRQVIAENGLPDLDVLHTIYRYHDRGLVKRVAGAKPMAVEARRKLLTGLQEQLAELIGPAAEAIIEEAFEAIHTSPDGLSSSEIPALYKAVRRHLDDEECAAFDRWVAAGEKRR